MYDTLCVNSLGEVIAGNNDYIAGSVDGNELSKRLGIPASKLTQKHFDTEFDRQLSVRLGKRQANHVKRIWELQKANNSRFRCWGGIHKGKAEICVCTEFLTFLRERDFWKRLKAFAKANGARYYVMDECKHLDHVIYDYDKPTRREVYGPDHGVMERQVEISWDVTKLSRAELRTLVKKLAKQTQEFWDKAGIGVI